MHYLNKAYIIATFDLFDHNCSFFFFCVCKKWSNSNCLTSDVNLSQIRAAEKNTLLVTVILTVHAAKWYLILWKCNPNIYFAVERIAQCLSSLLCQWTSSRWHHKPADLSWKLGETHRVPCFVKPCNSFQWMCAIEIACTLSDSEPSELRFMLPCLGINLHFICMVGW